MEYREDGDGDGLYMEDGHPLLVAPWVPPLSPPQMILADNYIGVRCR